MTDNTIYVSGPITYHDGPDRFAPLTMLLNRLGYTVINPKTVGACPDEDCVKLPHETEKGWKHSWACFLKHDLAAMLTQCDTIFMMNGWQDSHGARLELTVASATGLKILFEKDLYR